MEQLLINPTKITPLVEFDPDQGVLEIRGRSSPENSILFYRKIIDSLDKYVLSGGKALTANIALEYFNTSSSKCLFDVFRKLSAIKDSGKNVVINWLYEEEDDDIMEAGEDYRDLLGLPFNFIEIEI